MLHSVTFDKRILNRFVVSLNLQITNEQLNVSSIMDTACSTTLMPLCYAARYGKMLNYKSIITVGGKSYKASLYVFESVSLGTWNRGKLVAFAADYEGALKDRALIGLNVLNNLSLNLHRNSGSITFDYSPWELVKTRTSPCAMFFKEKGSAPVYPAELMTEEE